VAHGIVAALRLLRNQFGFVGRGSKTPDSVRFMARDIRGLLDAGEQARAQKNLKDPAVATADAFLGMIEGITERRHRSPSTKIIGRALSKIVGRPVDLDETTVGILRSRVSAGDVQYHVETHGDASADDGLVDYKATSPSATPKTGKHFRTETAADGDDEPIWDVEI
jgi:hypothetical protein